MSQILSRYVRKDPVKLRYVAIMVLKTQGLSCNQIATVLSMDRGHVARLSRTVPSEIARVAFGDNRPQQFEENPEVVRLI